MLDLKALRQNKEVVEKRLKAKDPAVDLGHLLRLDETVRERKTQLENLTCERNVSSKAIGEKKRRGENTEHLLHQMAHLAQEIEVKERELHALEKELQAHLAVIPNIPMEDVPPSLDKEGNRLMRSWGEKPAFAFPFKNHLELNEQLHLFDFKRAAKTSGSGWTAYRGLGARLEWALINFMLDFHIQRGFIQWMPPLLVRDFAMFGAGQLPKFDDEQFKLDDKDFPLYLIPTAESVLNGLHADEILPQEDLPLKYVAYTPCFRREAGAAGSQERGLIRMHQFNKVEMFCFSTPEQSSQIFEEMLDAAEKILQALGLHYRTMLLCTGDMSWAAAKTIDVEVWLPGQERYYEVSSISHCTDFQARRTKIRYRDKKNGKPAYLHTLNGSGLATSRLMVALLENNQQEDGSVKIPKVLQPYLDHQPILLPIGAILT